MNRRMKRLAVPMVAAAVLGTTGFAFMATNTVAATRAGAGENVISGYDVSGVTYNYVDNFGNPHLNYIKGVTFTLDHAAARASAQINNSQTWVPYTDCHSGNGGYTWTCENSTGSAANLAYFPGGSPAASMLNISAAQ